MLLLGSVPGKLQTHTLTAEAIFGPLPATTVPVRRSLHLPAPQASPGCAPTCAGGPAKAAASSQNTAKLRLLSSQDPRSVTSRKILRRHHLSEGVPMGRGESLGL